MNQKSKWAIAIALALAVGAGLGSSVNLHGNIINADTGYQLGAAAAQGHMLLGNGTYYVDQAFPPLVTNACTSYASSASGGCTVLPDGKWMEWGTTGDFDTGPVTATFPVAFPNACYFAQTGQYQDTGTQAQETLIVPTSGALCTTTTLTLRNNGSTNQTWSAIGD